MKGKAHLKLRPVAAAVRAAEGFDHELLIYGDIGESWFGESVSAKQVVEQLQAAKPKDLLVRVNSYGGSVTDGTAIFNAIRATGARVTVRIEGIAASIASLIAMVGDSVEMSPNTLLMIHAPWSMAVGNSAELREMADVLDTYAKAMATSYARKTGRSVDDELDLLTDGADHWFTAAEALEEGYCDLVRDTEPEESETEARARPRHEPVTAALTRYRTAPAQIAASMRPHLLAGSGAPAALSLPPPRSPAAAAASSQESIMLKSIARALGLDPAAYADDAALRAAIAAKLNLKADAGDEEISAELARRAAAAAPQPPAATVPAANSPEARSQEVRSMFQVARLQRPTDAALATMEAIALIDAERPVADVRADLLKHLRSDAEPIAGGYTPAAPGGDEVDKRRAAMTQALQARMGAAKPEGANPYRGFRLLDMARACVEFAGADVRGWAMEDIAVLALGRKPVRGQHTTSDFQVVLENTLHKMVLTGFSATPNTWSRFCKTGDVSDLREWNRLVPGMIGYFEAVNEAGEYKDKTVPDAEKNKISAQRRGLIIRITPDVIINDDIGYIQNTTAGIGGAGQRTIERNVYTLIEANPVLTSTGFALFSSQHANLAAGADIGAPSVATLSIAKRAMSLQRSPASKNAAGDVIELGELLDVRPAIALASTGLDDDIRVINEAQYDPDTANKLQRPNKSRGIVRDIVGSPRLSQYPWYLFADPNVAPVIEVVFLNGQRDPRLVQEEEFRTGGLAWRAELPHGVGAIDYRGAYKNPWTGP